MERQAPHSCAIGAPCVSFATCLYACASAPSWARSSASESTRTISLTRALARVRCSGPGPQYLPCRARRHRLSPVRVEGNPMLGALRVIARVRPVADRHRHVVSCRGPDGALAVRKEVKEQASWPRSVKTHVRAPRPHRPPVLRYPPWAYPDRSTARPTCGRGWCRVFGYSVIRATLRNSRMTENPAPTAQGESP